MPTVSGPYASVSGGKYAESASAQRIRSAVSPLVSPSVRSWTAVQTPTSSPSRPGGAGISCISSDSPASLRLCASSRPATSCTTFVRSSATTAPTATALDGGCRAPRPAKGGSPVQPGARRRAGQRLIFTIVAAFRSRCITGGCRPGGRSPRPMCGPYAAPLMAGVGGRASAAVVTA